MSVSDCDMIATARIFAGLASPTAARHCRPRRRPRQCRPRPPPTATTIAAPAVATASVAVAAPTAVASTALASPTALAPAFAYTSPLFFRRGALCMLACVVLGILCA